MLKKTFWAQQALLTIESATRKFSLSSNIPSVLCLTGLFPFTQERQLPSTIWWEHFDNWGVTILTPKKIGYN